MTDDTQPEAMDLADWLEAVGGGPSAKRCAALLREQHARIADLEAQLEAIGAGGVSGPLMGQPQAMPDLSALTERGAKAWAGVDAQGLRDGVASAGSEPVAQLAAERDELFQAAIDFIRTLTGMEPPPIEVAPPEVFAPFHAFVNTVQAIINKRNSSPREGMVMVPKEPTHHMLNAAASAYKDARQSLGAYNAPWAAYRAMLEVAAPPTAQAEGWSEGDSND